MQSPPTVKPVLICLIVFAIACDGVKPRAAWWESAINGQDIVRNGKELRGVPCRDTDLDEELCSRDRPVYVFQSAHASWQGIFPGTKRQHPYPELVDGVVFKFLHGLNGLVLFYERNAADADLGEQHVFLGR